MDVGVNTVKTIQKSSGRATIAATAVLALGMLRMDVAAQQTQQGILSNRVQQDHPTIFLKQNPNGTYGIGNSINTKIELSIEGNRKSGVGDADMLSLGQQPMWHGAGIYTFFMKGWPEPLYYNCDAKDAQRLKDLCNMYLTQPAQVLLVEYKGMQKPAPIAPLAAQQSAATGQLPQYMTEAMPVAPTLLHDINQFNPKPAVKTKHWWDFYVKHAGSLIYIVITTVCATGVVYHTIGFVKSITRDSKEFLKTLNIKRKDGP